MIPLALLLLAAPTPEDAKLATAFRAYLDDECRRHPVFASNMGVHDYDDQMDDLSPAARAEDVTRAKALLADLPARIDAAKLSRAGQIDLEIWTHALKFQLWQAANDDAFAFDPRTYGTYFSDSVFVLFTQSTLSPERNRANAAKRIAQIPKVLAAAKASLSNPPRLLTEIAAKRTAGAIEFYEKDIYQFATVTPGTSELAGPCRAAVVALKEYKAWLETELLPRSQGDWRLGKAKFAEKLDLELNAGLTAADVATVARYAAPVGFGNSFTRTSTAAIRDFYLPGLTGFAAGEVSATRASVAVIMIGTNDTAFTPFGQFGGRRHRRRRAGRDRGRGGGGRCPAGAGVPHRRHFAARLLCLRFRAANRRDRGCRR